MKRVTLYAFLLSGLLLANISLTSCENSDPEHAHTDLADTEGDSKKMAKDENNEKFEDSELKKDAKFAVNAADGGMLEVEVAQLAATNASSAAVKEFAKHIVEDHTKANEELKALALSKNISLPEALSEKSLSEKDKLAKKTGKDFDKDFVDFMVKDHKDDIDEFEKEAEKGNDAEVKAFASAQLPTLRHHLEMAESTRDGLKK